MIQNADVSLKVVGDATHLCDMFHNEACLRYERAEVSSSLLPHLSAYATPVVFGCASTLACLQFCLSTCHSIVSMVCS